MNPFDNPGAWTTLRFGQKQTPGMCVVSGFSRLYDWDIKKGKGVKGATITFTSAPPATGKVLFSMWTREHFAAWDALLPLFKYDPTKKTVSATDVYHPSLSEVEVFSLVVSEIGILQHAGRGMWTREIGFVEYYPPPKKNASGSPNGSKGTAGKTAGTQPDPIADAQQKEIARLLAIAQQP